MASGLENLLASSYSSSIETAKELAITAGYKVGLSDQWVYFRSVKRLPDQGWKIHVSSTVTEVAELFNAITSPLLAAQATFKYAASLQVAVDLNSGQYGVSQVGKIVTVYALDERDLIRLSKLLGMLTTGWKSPEICFDRKAPGNGSVWYRFGDFSGRYCQNNVGTLKYCILAPDGSVFADDRNSADYPSWVADPFSEGSETRKLPIPARFVVVRTLPPTPRGEVIVAFDLQTARVVYLKAARRHSAEDFDGVDAVDRLYFEWTVLERLQDRGVAPRPLELIGGGAFALLVMERLPGATLSNWLTKQSLSKVELNVQEIVDVARSLAEVVARLHSHGVVHGDLKSLNVIVEGQRCSLIDFDCALLDGAAASSAHRSTRGYSPLDRVGVASEEDDVFAVGALIYALCTTVEPAYAPSGSLLRRPIHVVAPDAHPVLADVARRCLDTQAADRISDSNTLLRSLLVEEVAPVKWDTVDFMASDDQIWRTMHLLTDSINSAAQRLESGDLIWPSTYSGLMDIPSRDIHAGHSGTLLALSELAALTGKISHSEGLLAGAESLSTWPDAAGVGCRGLYVGLSGVGMTLLTVGIQHRRPDLILRSGEVAQAVMSSLPESPDLYHGLAGVLRFIVALATTTGEKEKAEWARDIGERLLLMAEASESGGLKWRIPDGHESLSLVAQLGYAHGVAGVCDALLDLHELTSEEIYLEAARRGARLLEVSACQRGDRVDWPVEEGHELLAPPHWCHGAVGIGGFLLRLGSLISDDVLMNLAFGAARSAARGGRVQDPVLCHGSAGAVEFLIDCYQVTGDQHWVDEASILVKLMESFELHNDGGSMSMVGDDPDCASPDYLVGYGGTAVALSRYLRRETRARQLSLAGIRQLLAGQSEQSAFGSGGLRSEGSTPQ